MSEKEQADGDSGNAKGNNGDATKTYYWKLVFWGTVAFLALIFVSVNLPYLKDRAKFFTENALSLSILIAVIVQAIISNRQWRAMTDGLERTDRVIDKMQGQLVVMEDQAKAATAQAELAAKQVEFMVLKECAYITIDNLCVEPIRNHLLVVSGKFFNSGNTPALDFKRKFRVALGPGTPPAGWGQFDWVPDENEGIVLVKDGEINFSTDPLEITNDDIAKINDERLTIVMDGQCRFFDTLGGKQIYTFGVTFEMTPPHAVFRYQYHRREKANP